MAAATEGVLDEKVRENTLKCKILVVGAGGIGCELIKNLVLTGFEDIELIDLDTIDVSNLNRQFLFRKEHVGKSKAQVAKESALKFNPDTHIIAYHDSVMSPAYGLDFFKKFDLVMNALDNRSARNHVNRMCLAADIPLVESGTAGYLGQVAVIKKGLTECYECQPKPAQKTFPGCTIRNTPSEPIHCVVWAKHLFNQLFGEEDPDQDVSPDTADPELAGEAGQTALETKEIERKSTRAWAMQTGYNPQKLFNKLFRDDIKYLLSMEALWKKRRPPIPQDWEKLPAPDMENGNHGCMRDQRVWQIKESAEIFGRCLGHLKVEFAKQGDGGMLVWDKDLGHMTESSPPDWLEGGKVSSAPSSCNSPSLDDDLAMDFVTCTANIRAQIFGIPLKSRFDIKSMAGNIIPAIATTNAIIAGLIVMEGLKILAGDVQKCKTVYLNRQPNARKKLLVPCTLDPPNPKCYVCSSKPEVTVQLNTERVTVKCLEEKILKSQLGMVAPDVEIDDGKGSILISSEVGETEENYEKTLSTFNIISGTRLKCEDFLQNYNLIVIIAHIHMVGWCTSCLGRKSALHLHKRCPDCKPDCPIDKHCMQCASLSTVDFTNISSGLTSLTADYRTCTSVQLCTRDHLEEEMEFRVVGDLDEVKATASEDTNIRNTADSSHAAEAEDELMIVDKSEAGVDMTSSQTRKRKADDLIAEESEEVVTKKLKTVVSEKGEEDVVVL